MAFKALLFYFTADIACGHRKNAPRYSPIDTSYVLYREAAHCPSDMPRVRNRSLHIATVFFKINFKNITPKICLKFVRLLGMRPASSVGLKGSGVFLSAQLGK